MHPRRTLALFVFLVAFLPLGVALQPSPLEPSVFAITHARIVTEPGKEIPQGTIVIRNGFIEAVGPDVAPPADATIVQGKGLVVYSGFIDAGNSWGIDLALRRSEGGAPEPYDYAASSLAATKADNRKGVTPEFETATALKVEEETLEAWRKAGFAARLAFPEGGLFAGQAALVAHNRNTPRGAVVVPSVAQAVALRVPPGPGYPNTLMGIMAHARQTLMDAARHERLKAAFASGQSALRPPLDPAYDALKPVLRGQQSVLFEADTLDEIHRALDFCKEFKLKPTLFGGADAWKTIDRLKAENLSYVVRLNFPEKPREGPRQPGRARGPRPESTEPAPAPPGRRGPQPAPSLPTGFEPPSSDEPSEIKLPARAKAEYELRHQQELKNAGLLAAAGVRIAVSAQGVPPEKFLGQLRLAIKNGLAAEAALAALTINPAAILGVEQQFGRIAPGRPAHLTIFTGAFQEPSSQVRYVFADGQRFEFDAKADGRGDGPRRGGRSGPASRGEGQASQGQPSDSRSGEARSGDDVKPSGEGEDVKKEGAKKEETPKPELPTEIEADRHPKLKTGGDCLLRGATLLPVTGPSLQGDLLVKGGKIAALGVGLKAPEGVKVIDAAGLFVMPGIIDTHSHFSVSAGINEATLSVVPEVRVRDVVNSEDTQVWRGLAGGVTAARLLHGSANCIGGQDAVIKLKYGKPARELVLHDAVRGVKFALGENVKRGAGRFPNTRLGVEAVLVRAFTEAQAYRQEWQDYASAKNSGKNPVEPRRDLRLEALVDILDGKLLVHCHSYRSDEILMLLRVADRFGFRIKSLQHGLEGYKVAPEIAAHGASLSTFADWWAYKIEAFDAVPHNAALLQEAGVTPVLKSDSNELMRHLYQEAAKTLKYGGLSETEALKLITLNAAKQLSLDQRLGSLEVGKDADLAVFTAHPLSGYARCVMTFVDGEVFFDDREAAKGLTLPGFALPKPRGPGVPMRKIERSPTGVYLLKGATLHTVSGAAQPNDSLLIVDGQIKEVGANVAPPPGAGIVDAAGLHVYPGMIDAGTILGLTEIGSAQETQDFAEGGDFQPDLRASIGINPDSELIPVTRANGVLTVVSRPTGALVAGQSALINLFGWVPKDMLLVDPLGLHVDYPARVGVFSGTPNGPVLGRAVARRQREEKLRRLRQLFEQAKVLELSKANGVAKGPVDPRLEALIPYVKAEKPVVIEAQRQEEILQALKLADDLKLKVILSGGLESWKVADELKKRNVPVILGPVLTMPQEPHDRYDSAFTAARRLHEAGVKFCIRSEGGTNSRNLPYEAAMAVSYGLPAEEGLKAVTLYPAEILGVAERLGSLDAGKAANLVLTDGDLLQPSTNVLALFIAGVPLEPTSKQTKLYERYRERLKEARSVTK